MTIYTHRYYRCLHTPQIPEMLEGSLSNLASKVSESERERARGKEEKCDYTADACRQALSNSEPK